MLDSFSVGDWDFRWSGWQTPINQAIKIGFWLAVHPAHGAFSCVAPKGVVGKITGPTACINTCLVDNGGELSRSIFMGQDNGETWRQAAYDKLVAHIQRGEFDADL